MSNIKFLIKYIPWMLLAIVIGLTYMYWMLQPLQADDNDFAFIQEVFLVYGTIGIGLPLGIIIGVVFIYLDKKWVKALKVSRNTKFLSRIGLLIVAATITIFIHYLLEKWIDII